MNGNGHTVVDDGGDSFFWVNGSVSATFYNTTFDGFHRTAYTTEVSLPVSWCGIDFFM